MAASVSRCVSSERCPHSWLISRCSDSNNHQTSLLTSPSLCSVSIIQTRSPSSSSFLHAKRLLRGPLTGPAHAERLLPALPARFLQPQWKRGKCQPCAYGDARLLQDSPANTAPSEEISAPAWLGTTLTSAHPASHVAFSPSFPWRGCSGAVGGLCVSPPGLVGFAQAAGCTPLHAVFFSPSLLFARIGEELPVRACARGGAAHVCATRLSLAPSPEGKRALAGTEGQQKDISIILCHLQGARLLSESQRSAMKQ